MSEKNQSEVADQELLAEAKQKRRSAIIHAFMIGFMIAIIIWSIANNTVGLVTLIPLYMVYRLLTGPKKQVVVSDQQEEA